MMMNKALVEVFVPAAGKSFDAYIPLDSRLGDVVKLLSNAVTELSDGKYAASEDTLLCDADTGMIFNVNIEVAELNIKNGSRLMLI